MFSVASPAAATPHQTGISALDGAGCTVSSGTFVGRGQSGVLVDGACVPVTASSGSSGGGGPAGPPVVTMTIACSQIIVASRSATVQWDPQCGAPRSCKLTMAGVTVELNVYATLQQDAATKNWIVTSVWCPAGPTALTGGVALREQVLKLLPAVAIRGSSVPTTLVNVETVTWADTRAERPLATITVVGQKVWIKVAFDRGNWDYGDGATDDRTTPGNAYPAHGYCYTKLCDAYDGHVYTKAAWHTVTLAVTWTASYSLDGHLFQQITGGPVTGPTSTLRFHVRAAHNILVDGGR